METPAEKRARILGALEDLVAQECGAAALRDTPAIEELQRRSAPLVAFLCEHEREFVQPALRGRIADIVRRRAQSIALLASAIGLTRSRLEVLLSGQRRIAAMAPLYGRPVETRNRWQAVG